MDLSTGRTLSLLERRRNAAAEKLALAVERRDELLAKLCRAQAKLHEEAKALKRSEVRVARARSAPIAQTPAPAPAAPAAPPAEHELDVPGFLRRKAGPSPQAPELPAAAPQLDADARAAQAIRDEQAARRSAKARGRVAKLKAQQAGETRRMPLQGRAALAAIRNG